MTVKRFVSRLFRREAQENRIRAMWEPEEWQRQRRAAEMRILAWASAATLAVVILARTVL